VTTPSGKPPLDAQDLAGPDSSVEPPTPRQVPTAANAGESDESEEAPIYGTGVPYGGDDRTEEIDPVAIDMPFTPEERRTPKAPAVKVSAPKAAAPARDYELQMPVAQLTLSDLFDSAPSSTSLMPPDPAAFSSSRPPAAPERSREPALQAAPIKAVAAKAAPSQSPAAPAVAAKPAAQSAVVALPSIDVGAARAEAAPLPRTEPSKPEALKAEAAPLPKTEAPNPEAAPQRGEPTPTPVRVEPTPERAEASAPHIEAAPVHTEGAPVEAPALRPEADARTEPLPVRSEAVLSEPELARSEPAFPRPQSSFPRPDPRATGRDSRPPMPTPAPTEEPSEPRRRSVPTLESVGNAASKPAAKDPGSGPGAAGSSPRAARSNPISTLPPIGGSALDPTRFPSDVPTTRPPDVALSPGSAASGRPEWSTQPLGGREPRPPMTAVTSPMTVQGRASNLPSIMLAADVEAEPDSAARRAMRAARATVRLELPANFAQQASAALQRPQSHAPARAGVGHVTPLEPLSWLANPRARRLLGAAAVLFFLLALLLISLRPRSGSLVVTALGPGNRAVDDVTIFVDGKPLCDISPCRIKGLSPGMHTLRASAPNLASQAEETVEISAGDESTYNIDLLAVAPEVRAGGMRVPATDSPLTLFVDGKRVGRLPQEVSGLSGGKHWIKLDPEDGGDTIEKSVNILPGQTVEVEPKAARRDKALVTIRLSPGSEGAAVTFDDAFLLDFPAELELEPNSVHSLAASKAGYEDLTLEVKVAPGETEKLIDVALSPLDGKQAGGDGNAAPKKARAAKAARKAVAKPATTANTQLADSTQGLLNISSVPPSQIILNGRPLGSTPKTGITVPGDSLQTIVFVHPKMGRRRAQKFVPAGKERTVSIRF
jgi:hypothetical protein